MSELIESYALIGDLQTAALVSKSGSVDWLCMPRFDSPACFAALLGTEENGRFLIRPLEEVEGIEREYVNDSLVLKTTFYTRSGVFCIWDFMPVREEHPTLIRLLEGLEGEVEVEAEITIRFDYGNMIPWVTRRTNLLSAVAGPDAVALWTPAPLEGRNFRTYSRFKLSKGTKVPFVLSYHASIEPPPRPPDAEYLVRETITFWQDWLSRLEYSGPYEKHVKRSAVVLKALTHSATGGIVAAPTTSLPEAIGGERNWDYRYCWLRDATLTIEALLRAGFHDEALSFRDWLVRAVAGDVSRVQVLYGCAGERRLVEYEVPWLCGYEGSRPVRVGNAASEQFQLDVYGEVMAALHAARGCGMKDTSASWDLQLKLLEFLESHWDLPDEGIWEVRGGRRHFTYSKVMAWVAFDRAVAAAKEFGLRGDVGRWEKIAEKIRKRVLEDGYDREKGAFVQSFGSKALDGSCLLIPIVGFLPPGDERVLSTLRAVERELVEDGFVLRYQTSEDNNVDGLKGKEGAFLACTFWLVDNYAMTGRLDDAQALFERLLSISNDLQLLSEEYDTRAKRLVGNFPQAFSHISLINSAFLIEEARASKTVSKHFTPVGSLRLHRAAHPRSWLHSHRMGASK